MHRLTATDTPMVRYTRTIFPSYAKEVKNNLVIKIKNAFNNEIRYNKEELMSTKEGHSGLGIKSVKSVVSKYQGEIRMDITDNMFSVLIIIPFHP